MRPAKLLTPVLLAACQSTSSGDLAADTSRWSLPRPKNDGGCSLERAISERRSARAFRSDPLSGAEISQLLWAAQGVTDPQRGHRTSPSAGGIFPFDVYVATREEVARYSAEGHTLERVLAGDRRGDLARAAFGQDFVAQAPAVFALVAATSRVRSKYASRADRFVAMEAGHIAQNILLEATALQLGGVPVGAFDEDAVREVLGLTSEFQPLYLTPVGRPAL